MLIDQKKLLLALLLITAPLHSFAETYEIDASAFGTDSAPLPKYIKSNSEKVIVVHPRDHVWGAYNSKGTLVRWGLATAGSDWCSDIKKPCRTKTGTFRIFSLGSASCTSNKYPFPGGGASMPYCMYFNGSEGIHGSTDIQYANASHGCVRVHIDDAKWLRYKFVEGPNPSNQYRGTKVIVQSY
jgi:lipoprotein-anchoring transpeptidase ErfK/SrfK